MNSTRQVFTEEYFDTCREVEDLAEIEHYIADSPKCTGVVIETDTSWSYEEQTVPDLETLEYLPKLQIITFTDADTYQNNIICMDDCKVYAHDCADTREYVIRFPDDQLTCIIIEPVRS